MSDFNNHNKSKQRGFTLIELILSIGLMTVLMLGGVYSLMQLIQTGKTIEEQIVTTTNTKLLAQTLPKFLGMAINVDWTTAPINNVGAGKGQIRIYDSGFNLAPQPPVAVGLFLREAGSPNAGNFRGNLKGTAIYFQNPTPNTPGELRISTSGSGEGLKSLYSDASVFNFTDLVALSIGPAGHTSTNGEPVRAVRVQITSRKFYAGSKTNWCTERAIRDGLGDCASRPSNFRDIEKIIFVSLINNRISDESLTTVTGIVKPESLYGSLYFFNPVRLR
jgi:prepilin-type N-terminal cleavage/methylation domain-containing protein